MNGEKARRFFVRFDPQAVTKVLIAGFTVASLLGLAGSAEAAPAPDPLGEADKLLTKLREKKKHDD